MKMTPMQMQSEPASTLAITLFNPARYPTALYVRQSPFKPADSAKAAITTRCNTVPTLAQEGHP